MKRKIRFLTLAMLLVSAGVLVVSSPAQAATITAITASGAWNLGTSWNLNRVANSGDDVIIPTKKGAKTGTADFFGTLNNTGTVSMKSGGTFRGGAVTNNNGGIITATGNFMSTGISNNGTLSSVGNTTINGTTTNEASGNITISGGTFQSYDLGNYGTLSSSGSTILGAATNYASGNLTISGGTFASSGTMTNSGTLTISGGAVNSIDHTNNYGNMTISGGSLHTPFLYQNATLTVNGTGDLHVTSDGHLEYGNVTQTGGTFRIDGVTASTTYTLSGGTLDLNNSFGISTGTFAQSSTGAVTIDNGNFTVNGGSYTKSGAGTFTGNSGSLIIAQSNTLSGAGTFTSTGSGYTLNNSGKVTANGGTLDFSGFTGIASSSENTSTNGWYATSAGKLVLPSFNVTGDGTYNWGEASGDATIDMVNSIQLAFNGVTTGGDFSISLLASDNPDIPVIKGDDAKVAAVFDFDPPVGFTFTDVDLAFRYDDTVLASLGIPEASLKIYHNENGGWTNVTSSVDTANNIIYASGITSFSDFATGSGFATPEPATVVSGLIGLLGLAAKRFARRRKYRGV